MMRILLNGFFYFSTSSIDITAYFNVLVPKGQEINKKKGA